MPRGETRTGELPDDDGALQYLVHVTVGPLTAHEMRQYLAGVLRKGKILKLETHPM